MKNLQRSEINEVAPFLRPTVRRAWARGEKVPAGVKYLRRPTAEEIRKCVAESPFFRNRKAKKNMGPISKIGKVKIKNENH